MRTQLIEFIRAHKRDFAWTHHDILGIDPRVIVHKLNIDREAKPVKQKRRYFNLERYVTINIEVEKLIKANTIRETIYPE